MGKNKGKRKQSGARKKNDRSCSYERTGTWSVDGEDEGCPSGEGMYYVNALNVWRLYTRHAYDYVHMSVCVCGCVCVCVWVCVVTESLNGAQGSTIDSLIKTSLNITCCPDGSSLELVRLKWFRIEWRAEGASTLGRSGGMLPREILRFNFSKMHIWRILREN